ncbi:UNVERIFIED_CONTAM: DNA polymerase III gamma/tau subunit [Brevibacillus sp. OAP136]
MKKQKRSKWFKWKVGGGVVFSLALLMQTAKADPAFEKAHEAALQAADQGDEPEETASADPVIDEWKAEGEAAPEHKGNEGTIANALPSEQPSVAAPSSETAKTSVANSAQTEASTLPNKTHSTEIHSSAQPKANVASKTASAPKTASAQSTSKAATPSKPKNETPVPSHHQSTPTAAQQPSVPPVESVPATPEPAVENNSLANAPSSESVEQPVVPDSSNTDSQSDVEEQPKKSHTKSHHS